MATAEQYADWIVKNQDKKGSPEFETVAQAYKVAREQPAQTAPQKPELMTRMQNLAAGGLRGAGSIGATLMAPQDMLEDALTRVLGGKTPTSRNDQRRQDMTGALQTMGADPTSGAFQVGKVGGEIAGTLGVGPAVAGAAGAIPGVASRAGPVLDAISTAGMRAGGLQGARGMATRMAGGGISGGASAGLVDPNQAGMGAAVGAALPPALAAGAQAGRAVGAAARGTFGQAAPEVAALAKRAKELGIDIPADRLVSSKPLDAVSSALNYVPFSGRAATEAKMAEQLNVAASKLMGQNTPNINKAIRDASVTLGGQFDDVLKANGVRFDQQMLDEVSEVFNTAQRELGSDALKPIASQVDELVNKAGTGVIDGQAAYNIKRTLDRIGRQNTPSAFHALELKRVLMDGLNRSLGPEKAAAFAKTRQQYGNMLAFEKLAKNGVEGEISVARLANLRNINNEPLQELADIAAQFVKAREGQHGAMQRAVVGGTAALTAGPVGLAAGAGIGRGTNMLLNSGMARNALMGAAPSAPSALTNELQQYLLRAAPTVSTSR